MSSNASPGPFGRREFLAGSSLVLAASTLLSSASGDEPKAPLRVGLITDLHYADKAPNGKRYYRETLAKIDEAAVEFAQAKPDFVVELGDLIDAADSPDVELGYLKTINAKYAAISKDRHYVLGNHCVDMLTKDEFLGGVEQEKSYYSFDRGGFHFIVLDACFRTDGQPYGRKNSSWKDANLPPAELEWLAADLKGSDKPKIVFAHQRIDVNNDHGIRQNAQVRKRFETDGRVLAVFQGHSHQNDLKTIAGIHYCTLAAMIEGTGVESNGYSLLEIDPNGTIRLDGFRRQKDYEWKKA